MAGEAGSPRPLNRFKEQLVEVGEYASFYPGSHLVFRVPVGSLQVSSRSQRPLVEGEWVAELVQADGRVAAAGRGIAGEHALEDLCSILRTVSRSAKR